MIVSPEFYLVTPHPIDRRPARAGGVAATPARYAILRRFTSLFAAAGEANGALGPRHTGSALPSERGSIVPANGGRVQGRGFRSAPALPASRREQLLHFVDEVAQVERLGEHLGLPRGAGGGGGASMPSISGMTMSVSSSGNGSSRSRR